MNVNAVTQAANPETKMRSRPIGCNTGAEFVAGLDLPLAIERFRACLAAADSVSAATDMGTGFQCREGGLAGGLRADLEDAGDALDVLNLFEVSGAIKWFDISRGFGFLIPDNGLPDVLLHVTCLRASGFQTAYEGARLRCQVLRRPKGLQVFRILEMDESTAIHPSQLPQRTHVIVTPESDWLRAEVKWYSRIRGFGFLSRGEGQQDIFVHAETLRRFGFTELRPGQFVQVRYGFGSKGCMAAELRVDGRPDQWIGTV